MGYILMVELIRFVERLEIERGIRVWKFIEGS